MSSIRTLCLLVLAALSLAAQTAAPGRAEILQRLGLPSTYEGEVVSRVIPLRALGREVLTAKAQGPDGTTIGGAWVGDQPVDLGRLREEEIATRRALPAAKIRPDLRARMEDGETALRVCVWLEYPAPDWDAHIRSEFGRLDEDATVEEHEAIEAGITQWVLARVAENNQPLVEWVEAKGYILRYVSTSAPTLFLTLSPPQILELAAHPLVDTIYLESLDDADTNESANRSHRTHRVHEKGVRGRNVRVALLEDNGVDPNHPYLNVSEWFDGADPDPDNHIQGTSGCVASRLPSRLGAAPDVVLFSANADSYNDTDVAAAGDWIATKNIAITNNSWGPIGNPSPALDWSDRYFDYQSRTFSDSYFFSAGNAGLGDNVGNRGWNTIAVGSYSDQDDADWGNDVMSSFSATGDPATGCEKPNLVAVGDTIDTLGLSTQPTPWLYDAYSGTSFSSPHAAANLANAYVVDGTMSTPEPAMALMMAACWHNIEGSSRLSDQDGAGGLHALALFEAARKGQAATLYLTPTSFTNNGYRTYDIWLQGGDRTRVCIAWASSADSGYTTDVLDADLDLAIFSGQGQTTGTFHGSSASVDNNFEIVEFTPPTTGWYTVRINDWHFYGTSERCGVAWTQKVSDGASFRLRQRASQYATTTINATIGTTRWIDFDAPGSASVPYLCVPGVSGLGGTPLSADTWVPVSADLWTQLWLDDLTTGIWFWDDSAGVLSASGRSSTNRFHIPPYWQLEGLSVEHVGMTFDPAFPDTVREISEVARTKFVPAGTAQPASDDGSIQVTLPFSFPFFGSTYTSVWLNMNGNLTFGGSDSDWTESEAEMLGDEPRIALFWDDLGPHQPLTGAGTPTVCVRQVTLGVREVSFDFVLIPERTSYSTTTPGDGKNTGRITLFTDGDILLQWKDCSLEDCIVGISPGNGASGTPLDLSASGQRVLGSAIFEHFDSASPFDLSASSIWWSSVRFVRTSGGNYRVECELK